MLLRVARLEMQNEPLAGNYIWRQAQRQKQELALRRATRPLIIMRFLSSIYVVALAIWLLRSLWHPVHLQLPQQQWVGIISAGTGVAVALIALGAGYLLYQGKRSSNLFPST
jgi:hypothetical protein